MGKKGTYVQISTFLSWAVLPLVQKLVLKVKCRRLNWPTQAACKINNPAKFPGLQQHAVRRRSLSPTAKQKLMQIN